MNHEEVLFEEFLSARMKDKGFSVKRLIETTGIAPNHIENLLRGNFEELPSTPYSRGYMIRIGKVLDFDGEAWWRRIRQEGEVKDSGPGDALPENRFVRKAPPNLWWWAGAAVVLLLIYFAFQFPRIAGKPLLAVTSPSQNPFLSISTTFTIEGTVRNADAVYLSNGNASSSEPVTVAPDGSWQKTVLLQNGVNAFQIIAKKFLGSETSFTQEIIYQPANAGTSSASSGGAYPSVHFESSTPASGSYFQ